MNEAERRLAADRDLRNAARQVFDARIERIRGVLARKPVARRATDEAVEKARGGLGRAAEIAGESRWIIAGVAAGIVGWLVRARLVRLLGSAVDRLSAGEPPPPWRRWLHWTGLRKR